MRRAAAGFTLIELMVVMVLIGVLVSMVHISLGDNNSRNARQEADVLLGLIHGLREKAVLEGQEYGLRLEPEAYQLMRFEGEQWQAVEPRVSLPVGLVLTLTLDGQDQPLTAGSVTPQLLWLSSDENTAFELHLDSPPQRWRSIVSDGLADAVIDVPESRYES